MLFTQTRTKVFNMFKAFRSYMLHGLTVAKYFDTYYRYYSCIKFVPSLTEVGPDLVSPHGRYFWQIR